MKLLFIDLLKLIEKIINLTFKKHLTTQFKQFNTFFIFKQQKHQLSSSFLQKEQKHFSFVQKSLIKTKQTKYQVIKDRLLLIKMLIGSQQYPIQQSILFMLLLIFLVLDVFLFNRGHGSYTVKYQLMRKHRFFRVNQFITFVVDLCYKIFFSLPFIIIAIITILRGVKNVTSFPPILVNSLIVVLIIYPIHRQFYYIQYGIIWILAVASQMFTQFLTTTNSNDTTQQTYFVEISFIFYTLNTIVFCLALLYNQRVYWQLGDALKISDRNKVKEVNQTWADQTIDRPLPEIFYGGIYGHMYKNYSFSIFIGLYLLSIAILGVYAIVIYTTSGSYLGVTGLITSVVYDIFILIFSTLRQNQRSIKSIFYMVYIGRLLSFVFGELYWLFGYCIMYFLVGIFIGYLLIDKLFPLKIQVQSKQFKRQKVNALKTPQFVLLVLTVEIIVLIIVQQFTTVSDVARIYYHGQEIPVWQFAILIVIATWVVILYLLSGRLLSRHIQKIHSMVEYYFGFANFTQYHLYMILTYLLIIAAGLYSLFYLDDKNIFLACIFLPFLYLLIFEIGAAWVKNDYAILADTQEYNKREIKRLQIKEAKNKMMQGRLRQQRQNRNRNKLMKQKINKKHLHSSQQQQQEYEKSQNKLLMINNSSNKKGTKYLQQNSNFNNNNINDQNNAQQSITPKDSLNKNIPTPQYNQQQSSSQKQQSDINFYLNDQLRTSGDNMSQIDGNNDHVKQSVQNYKILLDWRRNKQLTYTEIWDNLTKHDKTIIVFSITTVIVFIVYVLVSYLWAETIGGLAFSLSIVSLMTTFVFYKINMAGQTYNTGEIITGIIGFVMGIVFWGFEYEITFGGIIWAVAACILYALSLKTGLQKHMQLWLVVLLISKIVLLLLFICLILWLNYGPGVGVVSISIVICCIMGAINVYYLNRQSHLPKFVKYLTGFVIVAIVVALAVIGFMLDVLSDFTVFTILMAIIIIAVYAIHLLIYWNKVANQYIHPHVYSAYGLTIYKFESQNQKLKSSTNHVIIFNISMILLVIYSAITTLFFKQKYMAIYSLSIFMIFQFTQLIFRSIETYYYMGKNKQQINQKIVRDTFKTVMEKYMPDQTQGQDSPQFIKKFKNKKKQALSATNDEDKNKLWKETVLLKEQVVKNLQQEQKFLFFWLALIKFSIYTQKLTQMTDFLITMEEIKPELQSFGIYIEGIDSTESTEIKYKLIQKQIKSLMPMDVILVEDLLKSKVQAKRRRLKQQEKLHKMNEQAHKDKLQELFKKQSQQIIALPSQIQVIKKSKSKIQQFHQALSSLSDSELFVDKEFKNDFQNIGQKLRGVVATWRRPKTGEKFITGDGMSPDDVKQGKIGDCYLISSFAVLGQKFIKKALGQICNSEQAGDDKKQYIWKNQKGAYMIRFHKFSRQVYVVVDDYLPVDLKNNWVFATSQDPLQFWPGILEKAYAKLYGGYQNIISGKCHQVLSQFTGGFPFQIIVKDYKSNMNALWNKMVQAQKNGYLLAAGSPSNERGDAVSSQRGIVQGHAYSILDVRLIQGDKKLIKLKNPHGSGGRQWNGAYSDESRYMTQKMREQLKHQKKDDGIFWMQLSDFINEFKSLYICCIFEKDWRKHDPIAGQWKKNVNSFGRPQKSIQSHKNYQIGINVQQKCTLFVSLTQRQISALEGQNFIYLRVQRNQGKRLKKEDVSSDALCGQATKPTNLATISQQIELQASQYPYTFTVYVSAQVRKDDVDEPGEGQFSLQIFCNDLQSKIIKHQEFDLIGMQQKDD